MDVGDVKVDELGVVVAAGPKGDRKTDLPQGAGEATADPGEGLGGLKLIVWHLKVVKHLNGQDVKPCAAVDEGLGDLHVADDG